MNIAPETVTEFLILVLILETLWTVQTSILRAAIGLAATSVLVSILMFQMGAALAAVFELSVCAGLITVVFVSTISMTRPQTAQEAAEAVVARARRFHPSFVVVGLIGALLWVGSYALPAAVPQVEAADQVRRVLWELRRLDLVGQILIMLVGAFGIVVLFKEQARKETAP